MNIKQILAEKTQGRKEYLEQFFSSRYQHTKPLFYSSVDIRNSGAKMVPVDTNLFPAGWNLLSENQRHKASEEVNNYFKTFHPGKKKVLIIPESHTKNKYYLLNVQRLSKILEEAGLDVKIGNISITEKFEEEIFPGEKITMYPVEKIDNQLRSDGFIADVIVNNNDLSGGRPDIITHLKHQPIIPPVGLGWFRRRKSQHFGTYDVLAKEFAREFDIDSWQISAYYERCGHINFKEKSGLDAVANAVENIIAKTANKYKQYGINDEPYAFIKANSGTYGMGIMVVKSAEEVLEINKKKRHSMNVIKEGVENSEVVVQEGIATRDEYQGKPAEPMVYSVNAMPIGCTYRLNSNQDKYGNLNSSGMEFISFDSMESENGADCPSQSIIARLASLAAARECYVENWEI